MAARTRLGLWGHNTRLAGSFAGKTITPHPVGRITRLGLWGHNTRRAGSFAGKPADTGGGVTEFLVRVRRHILR